MNRELESLILAYEAVSAARDTEAEHCLAVFEALLDDVLMGIRACPAKSCARASSGRIANGR